MWRTVNLITYRLAPLKCIGAILGADDDPQARQKCERIGDVPVGAIFNLLVL